MSEQITPITEDEIKFIRELMEEKKMVRLFWLSVFRWAAIIGGLFTFFTLVWDFVAKHTGTK